MLNQPDYLFSKNIRVFGKPVEASPELANDSIRVDFFPEGGNLISGLENNMAFKAVDANGLPADVELIVSGTKGEIMAKTQSFHDGMGRFTFTPREGEEYYAEIVGASRKKYVLPQPTQRGVTMRMQPGPRHTQFVIEHTGENPDFASAYMIGQMQNTPVFRQQFSGNKKSNSGQIQTASLPSGIMQVTVFNADDMPLAERLIFVNNREYLLTGSLILDSLNAAPRQANKFLIDLPDTVSGSFSVSVTDADLEGAFARDGNIHSYFLLTSDIKGYVHRPAWYFSAPIDSAAPALDLLMMTHGWRRFLWQDLVDNKLKPPAILDEGFIKLAGRATLKGTDRPLANSELLLMIAPADNASNVRRYSEILFTDEQGYFSLDSLVFYENSGLIFSPVAEKSRPVMVELVSPHLRRKLPLEMSLPFPAVPHSGHLNAGMNAEFADYLREGGNTLEDVTITAQKKTPMERLDDYYTTGMFSGGATTRALDLTKEAPMDVNIFEYLRNRVPGISVVQDQGFHIFYRKPITMQVIQPIGSETVVPNAFGNTTPNEMQLYVDEFPVQGDYLATIMVKDIAYVKVFSTFPGAPGGGGDGVLAVYLKKDRDSQVNRHGNADLVEYNGYSIIRQFFSPDYSTHLPEQDLPDRRLTLLWEPGFYVNGVNVQLPVRFYNNDRTKRFKITVEGVTNDGRMLLLERIAE